MDKDLNIFQNAEVDLKVNGGPTNIGAFLGTYDKVVLKPNKKGSKNVLEQWMLSAPHTKYVIKYDFTLEDTIIEIPEDCIIEIDCGSLQHGTLVGHDTVLLNTNNVDNALVDITLDGTWVSGRVAPDEEDITKEKGLLKFANKAYEPNKFSGLGRVYLRKNINPAPVAEDIWMFRKGADDIVYLMYRYQGVVYHIYDEDTGKGVILENNLVKESDDYNIAMLPAAAQEHNMPYVKEGDRIIITLPNGGRINDVQLNQTEMYYYTDVEPGGEGNILTQDMINKPNTIYIIQYDYTLGENITVPANCVLEFDGGSIDGSGYKIYFDQTRLDGSVDIDAECYGTIFNYKLWTSWFNKKVSNIVNLSHSNHYWMFDEVIFDSRFLLEDVNNLVLDGCGSLCGRESGSMFICGGTVSNIEVKNFNVVGTVNTAFFHMFDATTISDNIYVHDNRLHTLKLGISFNAHHLKDAPNTARCTNCIAENNYINLNNPNYEAGNYGIHIANASKCIIKGNYITGCQRHALYHAYGSDNKIINNIFENNGVLGYNQLPVLPVIRSSKNVFISGNVFKDNIGDDIRIAGAQYDPNAQWEGRDTTAENIIVTNNTFESSCVQDIKSNACIQVGNLEYITKNVTISGNTITVTGNKDNTAPTSKTPFNIYNITTNLSISDNTIKVVPDTDDSSKLNAYVFFFPNAVDFSNGIYSIIGNRISLFGSSTYAGYVFSFNLNGNAVKEDLVVQDNVFLNQRLANELLYNIYPNGINLSLFKSLQTDKKVLYLLNNFYTADITDTGYYNVVDDVIIILSNTGQTSTLPNILGYRCVIAGNPGTWRAIGENTMNIPTLSGKPGGKEDGGSEGFTFFYDRKLLRKNGGKWFDAKGFVGLSTDNLFIHNAGDTSLRPLLDNDKKSVGLRYFDTTIGKPIYWTGTIWTDAVGTRITWPITFTLTNVTASNMGQPSVNVSYTTTLNAAEGYSLPTSITVKMGSVTLEAGRDYTYDQSTGTVVILGTGGSGGVTAAITITAEGVANS